MARRGAKRKPGDRYPSGKLREPARGKAGVPTKERAHHAEIIRERLARRRRAKSKDDVPQIVDANGDQIEASRVLVKVIRAFAEA
jgi:hypothetical protein